MKVRDNRMRYRRRIYQKKRIKFIVITASVCVLVFLVLFLIIGNILGDKVEQNIESRKPKDTTEAVTPHASVRSVNATPLALGTKIPEQAGDICFYLEGKDGAAVYASEIAPTATTKAPKLTDFAEKLHASNGYGIGIIRLSSFKTDNDLERAAAAGYYSAMIAEALRAGVDEILIYTDGVSAERYGELIGIASEVRRLCPSTGHIGISVPASVLSSENGSAVFDSLWGAFDYVALDVTQSPPEGVSAAEHTASAVGNSLYYILRYNIRVLLPSSDDTALSAMRAEVEAAGSVNIQIMP